MMCILLTLLTGRLSMCLSSVLATLILSCVVSKVWRAPVPTVRRTMLTNLCCRRLRLLLVVRKVRVGRMLLRNVNCRMVGLKLKFWMVVKLNRGH